MPTISHTRTPRDAVTSAFAALKSKNYIALAELCDPISLRAFKAEMVDEYCERYRPASPGEATLPPIELTAEQYAEWREVFDPLKAVRSEFPDLSSPEDLRGMTPVELFSRWLSAQSFDCFLDEDDDREPWQADDASWSAEGSPARDGNDAPEYEIIGCVFGDPDIAHVLYRNRFSAADIYGPDWISDSRVEYREFMDATHHRGDPTLISCRRQSDGSWRLIAKRTFMLFGSLQIIDVYGDD
jgi:hypothetical protein